MSKNDFIEWLDSIGAEYGEYSICGTYMVYVYKRDEIIKKRTHPRKYKNLYVPYIRVSWHPEDPRELYIRDNGLCSWTTESVLKDMIKKSYV